MNETLSPKFFADPEATIASQCVYCAHLGTVPGPARYCTAFPGGIPRAIIENRADHRRPYLINGRPADAGMPGAGSITFTPRDDVPAGVLASLDRTLDALK